MDALQLWKLCDEYTIIQATLLACGCDPDELQWDVERTPHKRPVGYGPIKTALEHAVGTGRLPAKVKYQTFEDYESTSIDPQTTLVSATDLDAFFRSKGHRCELFERATSAAMAGNLSPANPYYPRKLDAAIKAWTAVTSDPVLLRGRSPKQALTKWLTENAVELGLLNRDDTVNKGGIEEICKVANWRPEGGAVPTPSGQPLVPPPSLKPLFDPPRPWSRGPKEAFPADIDDEIPF